MCGGAPPKLLQWSQTESAVSRKFFFKTAAQYNQCILSLSFTGDLELWVFGEHLNCDEFSGEIGLLFLLSCVQSSYWLYLHTGWALSYSHFVLCSRTVIPFHLFWLVCCYVISPEDLFVFLRPALDQCFMDSCQSSFCIPRPDYQATTLYAQATSSFTSRNPANSTSM